MDPDSARDLRSFTNVCSLFPLPKVVLFPHAVVPLYIFEPRYRQMTEDALAGDRLVTMVQWRAPIPTRQGEEPALESIACLGRILQHERLPDGRFHILLLGLKRVRLGREIKSDKLYRLARAEILEDENTERPQERPMAELVRLFRWIFEKSGSLDPALHCLLEDGLTLGALTDLVAHALGVPPATKQQLLAETCVDRRAELLIDLLQQLVPGEHSPSIPFRDFPPPFSAN